MAWDVAGLGNALMDALVILDDDTLIDELGLVRGTMHPVDHARWQQVYERVRRHKVTFDSGGSCANTIATIGRLGARAVYCGQVGDDQMGRMYASLMERACGKHALRFSKEQATGKCLSIISGQDAERTMLTDLGASIGLSELGDFAGTLEQTRIAHFTGYTLLDGPMRQVVLEAMHRVGAAGGAVSLDVADPFVVMQTRDLMWSVIENHADIVFLNAEEARGLTGLDPEQAVLRVGEHNVNTVVVKLGGQGSLVLHNGELHHIDIRKVKAIDTTGAGDSYAGGFLYGMVQGWDARRCGELASWVAGLAVAQIGAVVKDQEALAEAVRTVGADWGDAAVAAR